MQVKDLITNVQDVLRRPDLDTQVGQRVRGAILWAHKLDYFVRDRRTVSQTVQSTENPIRLSLPPYWRQFEVIRPLDSNSSPILLSTDDPDNIGYQEIDPRSLLDYQQQNERNYYYVAGDVINIMSEVIPAQLHFVYFDLPDVRDEEARTWITEQYQELIEFRALGVMYSILGNQELRNTYMGLAAEHKEQLLDNAFQAGSV